MGLTTVSANAQATRTWVSGVGDDANPCSRTAPCKTFAGAISKTASGGEINCIDPGGFGAVTITKPITLDCTGTFGSILHSGTSGVLINPTSVGNVTLRGLSINGGTPASPGINGVRILAAANVLIENCRIFNNGAAAPNGHGVLVNHTAGAVRLVVKDSTLYNNTGGGILLKPGAGATVLASLTRVDMHNNLYGLRVEDGSKANVFQSSASENVNNGFVASSASAPAEINLIDSMAANNGANGVNTGGGGATIRMLGTGVFDNATGINIISGNILGTSPDTNSIIGNTTDGAVNGNVTLQ